jgi:hypothetical protein
MGVRGLTTYLNPAKNPGVATCAQKIADLASNGEVASLLFRCCLVIDGNSLVYHLITEYDLASIIAAYGGPYARFEQVMIFLDCR